MVSLVKEKSYFPGKKIAFCLVLPAKASREREKRNTMNSKDENTDEYPG
jgi:hypothetical protein